MGWLGTLAHEYFHNWNIKRLRPVELGPFDYENENYVKTLWVAEGFTDYYADILPRAPGIRRATNISTALSSQIEAVQTTPGRLVTPVNMASFDTWIKQYRPDENTANMSINYYPKGAVIAFLLDARIRKATNGARIARRPACSGRCSATRATRATRPSSSTGDERGGRHRSARAGLRRRPKSTEELDYTEALD